MIQISSCLQLEKCVGKLPARERERERECVCVCREGFIATTIVEKTRVGAYIRSFPVFHPTDRARTSSYRFAKKQSIALAQKLCFAKKQKALIDCLKDKRSRRRRGNCLRLPADHSCDRGEGVASEIDFPLSLSLSLSLSLFLRLDYPFLAASCH